MELIAADNFTLEELTEAYNQTRVDYLVPMPMNVARLREYIYVYDVDLSASCVAMDGDVMLGLGMLGIRQKRGWITRLGVLPSGRRRGVGSAIMQELIGQAQKRNLKEIWLEVIKGNTAGFNLFRKFEFEVTRELIVARRAPAPLDPLPEHLQVYRVTPLNHEEAIILLSHRQGRPNWLIETESMQNARNLSALLVELENGGRGWVTYHAGLFQLTRIVVEVTVGDPQEVTWAVLHTLHQRYKRQDAVAENLCDDEKWPGYERVGYFDAFRRIEMVKTL
ncbi:MAG: GNAT family N-acetyltransferase [Chloroflexi bacterium]|nr:MAG: GNAT family N-acetyltransferase [Chloroflexota bacterium]